ISTPLSGANIAQTPRILAAVCVGRRPTAEGPRLPLAGSRNERVGHSPPTGQRQRECREPYHELGRWTAVKVQGIRTSEPGLPGRLREKAREGDALGLTRNDDDNATARGADSSPFRQLRLQPRDLAADDETGEALADPPRGEGVG